MIEHVWIGPPGPGNYYGSTFDLSTPGVGKVWIDDRGVEGLGTGAAEAQTHRGALQDGQLFTGWTAPPREVFWPVVIDGSDGSWWNLQREFWESLPFGQHGTWRVTAPDGSIRELRCRFVGDGGHVVATDPSIAKVETVGVELIADDPWWKGPALETIFQTREAALPFFATTSDRVLNIASANTIDSAEVTNPGELPAWPVIRVDGPASRFELRFLYPDLTDPSLGGDFEVPAGGYLIVDTSPTEKRALLYDADGNRRNVTRRLSAMDFRPINPRDTTPVFVTLNGTGSLSFTITPRYRRGY